MNKKVNWEYVASVEKAIAEKYGKDAVQDFRSCWDEEKEKEYLAQLKEASYKEKSVEKEKINIDGVLISKKVNERKYDRTCPVCKTYSFSMKDDLYMNRFRCCQKCYYDFVHDREERWYTGWRPSDERIQEVLKRRKKQHGKY